MFKTFFNAFKVKDIRKRILLTLLLIVIYRLGCFIPIPGVNVEIVAQAAQQYDILGFLDLLTGSSFSQVTLFAMGISPYITASIILQLLTIAIPSLERMSKEEDGRQKIERITRYTGAGIALALGIGYYFLLRGQGALVYGSPSASLPVSRRAWPPASRSSPTAHGRSGSTTASSASVPRPAPRF